MESNWQDELPVGITVCDEQGVILSMNDRAALIFKKSGGSKLVGKSLMDCHPLDAQEKIRNLLEQKKPNAYTLEKNGRTVLLYQSPWYEQGAFKGFVEFIFELPEQMNRLAEIRWVNQ
ncbi:MAG TPA: PAS domain-containing protein [Smithellaceae bacterium]|nr:PAS domain-containing protein [Smithellaceae bacterium]